MTRLSRQASVINYRSTFATEIRNKGLDGLIERLVKHNARPR